MQANAWALDKDRSIKRLLLLLAERLGPDAFAISQRRQDDFRAIHLCKPDDEATIAYVYSYGQAPGRYGLHLEYPDLAENPLPPPEIYEDLGSERVVEIIALHFEVYAG